MGDAEVRKGTVRKMRTCKGNGGNVRKSVANMNVARSWHFAPTKVIAKEPKVGRARPGRKLLKRRNG